MARAVTERGERGSRLLAFVAHLRVRFSDLDPLGHVNNAAYINYLEQAAIDHAEAIDLGRERLAALGGVFIARRHVIDYLKPAVADDRLQVVTWIGEMQGARATRFYQIQRQPGSAEIDWPRRDHLLAAPGSAAGFGDLILRASTDWAYVDVISGRPRRLPPEVISIFGAASPSHDRQ